MAPVGIQTPAIFNKLYFPLTKVGYKLFTHLSATET
jgi:hypothetical protein